MVSRMIDGVWQELTESKINTRCKDIPVYEMNSVSTVNSSHINLSDWDTSEEDDSVTQITKSDISGKLEKLNAF